MVPRDALLEALSEIAAGPSLVVDERPERWLTAEEAASTLQVSPRWVYDHGAKLGARHLSKRCVRFSSRAIERYLSRKG